MAQELRDDASHRIRLAAHHVAQHPADHRIPEGGNGHQQGGRRHSGVRTGQVLVDAPLHIANIAAYHLTDGLQPSAFAAQHDPRRQRSGATGVKRIEYNVDEIVHIAFA